MKTVTNELGSPMWSPAFVASGLAVLSAFSIPGCAAPPASLPAAIVVLVNRDQHMPAALDCPACIVRDVRDTSPLDATILGVVVSGHSQPPEHLIGLPVGEVVRRIKEIDRRPGFLILDTCFGASADVLVELAAQDVRPAQTLAAASRIPLGGFRYGSELGLPMSVDPSVRLRAVTCCNDRARELVRLVPEDTARVAATWARVVEQARTCALDRPLVTILPNRVALPLCDTSGCRNSGPILYPIAREDWCPGRSASFTLDHHVRTLAASEAVESGSASTSTPGRRVGL